MQRVAHLPGVAGQAGELRDLPVRGHSTPRNEPDDGVDALVASLVWHEEVVEILDVVEVGEVLKVVEVMFTA